MDAPEAGIQCVQGRTRVPPRVLCGAWDAGGELALSGEKRPGEGPVQMQKTSPGTGSRSRHKMRGASTYYKTVPHLEAKSRGSGEIDPPVLGGRFWNIRKDKSPARFCRIEASADRIAESRRSTDEPDRMPSDLLEPACPDRRAWCVNPGFR